MVEGSGGRPLKRKACAIAEFIRLDSLHAYARADADAGAGGADGAGDCGVLVPVDADAPRKRHRLRRKLTKLWVRLARRRLRTQRSQIIIKEIRWCLRNTTWTLTLIKQHVADKSGVSVDIGHHRISCATTYLDQRSVDLITYLDHRSMLTCLSSHITFVSPLPRHGIYKRSCMHILPPSTSESICADAPQVASPPQETYEDRHRT